MKVGIFFGGLSREREISFAGGRTVFDNLDKTLFEVIPIFVDSFGNFAKLKWEHIYKGTIRDFYPDIVSVPPSINHFQVYADQLGNLSTDEQIQLLKQVGDPITLDQLKVEIDFAFLALHGSFGEDGTIQGLMEFAGIPYSGSGILPSAIGMNKVLQKKLMRQGGFLTKPSFSISRNEWIKKENKSSFIQKIQSEIGFPFVVRPANQGSSIGVRILKDDTEAEFTKAVNDAFFIGHLRSADWNEMVDEEKISYIRQISELKDGIGLPFKIGNQIIYHPENLLKFITDYFKQNNHELFFESVVKENEVLIEGFIGGKEFSCIVIQDENGNPVALPPTEIVKGKEVFDYRSKYLAGLSRKITPIQIPDTQIENIRTECEKLFNFLGFHVYARIDGFIESDGSIFLNDPNTTSGMLPSSFFFHQAAEIGLNPSQFLTYLIYTSLVQRNNSGAVLGNYDSLINELNQSLESQKKEKQKKINVAVILGGYSSERHISVESGRNIFEKLSASGKYKPFPVFLSGNSSAFNLYQIPINILLKDNADDIHEKIKHFALHPVIEKIKDLCKNITSKFAGGAYSFLPAILELAELKTKADVVFIALHGRPGEDGAIQKELEKIGLPYNGSGVASSQITINKFATNQLLLKNGFIISNQLLVQKKDCLLNKEKFIDQILSSFEFPFIVKPVDDGCSSAVKKIKSKEELESFSNLIFRDQEEMNEMDLKVLHLKPKEEFPMKQEFLVEKLISSEGAKKFLEITGGMLTHLDNNGQITYEFFEPSETLASQDVLSLEEKFLAGEGQNITPARFSESKNEYEIIAKQVKSELEKAARILGVEGYCRIDAFVRIYDSGKVETEIIEVNSLPGMTPATCIYHQAAMNGYKPFDFIDQILEFSIQKNKVGKN